MAGLVQNAMTGNSTVPKPDAGVVTVTGSMGVDPERRAIDAAKETVAGQLDSLLKADSAYITRARANAAQAANRRGLLNTSMAVGEGEAAAINAALPIATADANVHGTAARDNQIATNAALTGNADAANKAALVSAESANQMALQGLRGEQATILADIEANYKNLIQASHAAGNLYNDTAKMIAAINTDGSLDAAGKSAAIAKQAKLLNSGLSLIGAIGNVNLAGLLNFNG